MKMQAPEGCPGISLMGKFYEAVKHEIDEVEKFIVDIPSEFKAAAESHGFVEHVEVTETGAASADAAKAGRGRPRKVTLDASTVQDEAQKAE